LSRSCATCSSTTLALPFLALLGVVDIFPTQHLYLQSEELMWVQVVLMQPTIRNGHPEDLALRTLSTELKVSKNRLFIRQVEWRVRSWVEPVLPLKMMDNQLGEPNAWNHNLSGPLFP
nr:hypothetical protein [Tanacetum cinerariifolium]